MPAATSLGVCGLQSGYRCWVMPGCPQGPGSTPGPLRAVPGAAGRGRAAPSVRGAAGLPRREERGKGGSGRGCAGRGGRSGPDPAPVPCGAGRAAGRRGGQRAGRAARESRRSRGPGCGGSCPAQGWGLAASLNGAGAAERARTAPVCRAALTLPGRGRNTWSELLRDACVRRTGAPRPGPQRCTEQLVSLRAKRKVGKNDRDQYRLKYPSASHWPAGGRRGERGRRSAAAPCSAVAQPEPFPCGFPRICSSGRGGGRGGPRAPFPCPPCSEQVWYEQELVPWLCNERSHGVILPELLQLLREPEGQSLSQGL
ncbi:collagen alpha-1(I) chain-like [Prinia subflava]|uniref:collagen alpha-1(I) chain-like n=1 Tax=Prinia subflava TaxID=208062 RepID=UPI002FE00AB1